MSYAISAAGFNATGFGALGLAIANATATKTEIAALIAQSSSGYRAPDFAGLGNGAHAALDLSGELGRNTAIAAALDDGGNRMAVAQTALAHIQSVVGSFSQLLILAQTSGVGIDAITISARAALTDVANTLDTKIGADYVFAGQDSTNPPLPDPSSITQSTFYTAIAAAVAGLTVTGQPGVSAQTLAIAAPGAQSPFAASLEASNVLGSVSLGNAATLPLGVLADQNSDAVSAGTGTTSTGSYMRDILRGLATIGALTTAQQTAPGFNALLQDTATSLTGAATALNIDIGALGARQVMATAAKADISNVSVALQTQLTNIQEVDLPLVATQLSQAQTRLQASYQVIAQLSQLSLAKYLPA